MRTARLLVIVTVLAVAGAAIAHHNAAGIVDDDVYQMIDDLVAETPHGAMDDLPAGDPGAMITNVTIKQAEDLMSEGLLIYAGMLDGPVSVEIDLEDMRNVVIYIYQQE